MRLPLSPFEVRAYGVAVTGGPDCNATQTSINGAGVVRSGAELPISVPLPLEPEAHRLALDGLAQRPDEAVSLAFTLPFCAAHCLCCDRDILAAQPEEVIGDYVDGLIEETRRLAERLGTRREVLQLNLGGGSASELEEVQVSRLVHAVRDAWHLPADAEMSIDCDPRRVGWMQMQLLRSLGFTHVNFGVLDLDPRVQQAIGRRHSAALIDDVCEVARSCDIEYVNLGLMIGLPHQNLASWRDTLRRVVAMAPDRISLQCYRHQPRLSPGQYAIDVDALPEPNECLELMRLTAEVLRGAGYCWLGSDQFVLETDQLAIAQSQGRLRRSLVSYTTAPPSAMLAQGVAAVGEIDGHVFSNTESMAAWRQAVRAGRSPVARAQPLTPWRARVRQAQQQLQCQLEVPQALLRDGLQPVYARLARHVQSGWIQVQDDRLVVTEAGRLALPQLIAELDELPLAEPGPRPGV